jgi:hypothetical protein
MRTTLKGLLIWGEGSATLSGLLFVKPVTQGSCEARQPWALVLNRFAVADFGYFLIVEGCAHFAA